MPPDSYPGSRIPPEAPLYSFRHIQDLLITLAWILSIASLAAYEIGFTSASGTGGWLVSFLSGLRLVLGLGVVLYLPGYWLAAALFAHQDDLDALERAGLGLGLSVAWVPILALLLDRLPWGLHLWPVLIGELASIGIFMSVAVFRRFNLPTAQAYLPSSWLPGRWLGQLLPAERRIFYLASGAVIVAFLAVASAFFFPSPANRFTEFYIVGPDGLAENYPRFAVAGQPITLTAFVRNLEGQPVTYTVRLRLGSETLIQSNPFQVSDQASRELPLSLALPTAGKDQELILELFRQGSGTAYRTLRLYINVEPAEKP